MLIIPLLSSAFAFATTVLAHSTARNPITAISNVQNATIHTYNHRVHHLSHFDVSLRFFDRSVKLSLQPNHDIIAEGAHFQELGPDGEVKNTQPIERADHKVYKGITWAQTSDGSWERAGSSRIYIRRDGAHPLFSGTFSISNNYHHIMLSSNYQRTRHSEDPEIEVSDDEYMVLWRDSDISTVPASHQELKRDGLDKTCRADSLSFNMDPEHPVYTKMLRREENFWSASFDSLMGKRQLDGTPGGGNGAATNLVSNIGNTAGCSTSRRVARVGVVTDCTYTAEFNSTESAREHVIEIMNSASQLYESTFNISLGLQNLTTTDPNCPSTPPASAAWNLACSSNRPIEDRLNLFSSWRGQQSDENSHWTLLSTCTTDSAVGLAWLGQACVQGAEANGGNNAESVAGANVVIRTQGGATEWQVIAHETGHTFGAVHDCIDQTCSDGSVDRQQCCPLSTTTCNAGARFIMNPSTSDNIENFSQCTIGNICSAFGTNSVNTQCFTNNRNLDLVTGQQCGNGIVEEGEQCDCGGEQGCQNNNCCNPTTCQFINNAVCDDANEGCCNNCQFASANIICRASTSQCDPEERCTGDSPYCPDDTTSEDGTDCGNGLRCASGQCTSRDEQCKAVMGTYLQGNQTYACNTDTCMLSCASPQFQANECASLQQNFLDGTECGSGGGSCQNGRCTGNSLGRQIGSWISRNRNIVIGVACGVGGLILFIILCCVISCCRKRRGRKAIKSKTAPSPPNSNFQQAAGFYGGGAGGHRGAPPGAWNGPAPPPYQQNRSQPSSPRNGPWVPPPMQSQPSWHTQNGPQAPPSAHRGSSVRYA